MIELQAAKQGTDLISSATVVVHVDDINERPVFLSNHYIAWVSEHANIGEPVHAFISAVDYDEASHGITYKFIAMLIVIGTKWIDSVQHFSNFRKGNHS